MPSLETEVVEDDSSSDSEDSDGDDEKVVVKKLTKNMSSKMKVVDHFYDIK